ncbi:hypothetical protein [Enterococcus gilvus]|uniref:hypothetical protein n=1 Tax=Enterococcus gilvus TaxID=160453 RepID=UPI0028D77966|nr:hypothetical protein [Enterococcus gilvus]
MKTWIEISFLAVLLGTVFFVVGGLVAAQISTLPALRHALPLLHLKQPTMPLLLMKRLGTSPLLWGSSFLLSGCCVYFQRKEENL